MVNFDGSYFNRIHNQKEVFDKKETSKSSPTSDQQVSIGENRQALLAGDLKGVEQKVAFNLSRRETLIAASQKMKKFEYELHEDFVVSQSFFDQYVFFIDVLAEDSEEFDSAVFLAGPKSPQRVNAQIIDELKSKISELAHAVAIGRGIPIDAAYRQLIGLIDCYDEAEQVNHQNDRSFAPRSTFALRSALLLAAQADNGKIESWMVYTKRGKPSMASGKFWVFLDKWQNWIPEAQGKYAKFIEAASVQARSVSKAHAENQVVLMKGGFGAGKTRLTQQKFGEQASGVVAPDKGKAVTRRGMPEVAHHVAHVEGSQVAYSLFDALIREIHGTVVYDSSLNNPRDISDYIQKIKTSKRSQHASPPTLRIYDVARRDEARFLAVLRREVGGEDPRIPPERMIQAALLDKMNRHRCIEVAMNEKALNVEYNFLSGDASGWDTQFVSAFRSTGIEVQEPYRDRLDLEGLAVEDGRIVSTLDKLKVEIEYWSIFNQPVSVINGQLSPVEQEINEQVFGKRILIQPSAKQEQLVAVADIWAILDPKVQQAILKPTLIPIFNQLTKDQAQQLIDKVNRGEGITYLDLPLRVAAEFHCALTKDPWL